jgi:hypothetical protein
VVEVAVAAAAESVEDVDVGAVDPETPAATRKAA